jgi:hypothetical protein
MPERERPQERPQRRRRRQPAAQQPPRAPRPQQRAVLDAVGAEEHRVDERHDLARGVRGARPVAAQPHQIPCQRLEPQAARERRGQHHAGVRHDPLIVELDLHAVQSDGRVIVHHEGDL